MDLPVPAVALVSLNAEAQDRASLEVRANQKIFDEGVLDPISEVCGFDVGCMGNGATWLASCFVDTSHIAPPTSATICCVPILQAAAFFAEALDERSLTTAFINMKARIFAVAPFAKVVASRCTGGGAGGKYLIGVLVDLGSQTLQLKLLARLNAGELVPATLAEAGLDAEGRPLAGRTVAAPAAAKKVRRGR